MHPTPASDPTFCTAFRSLYSSICLRVSAKAGGDVGAEGDSGPLPFPLPAEGGVCVSGWGGGGVSANVVIAWSVHSCVSEMGWGVRGSSVW
jgi:hypothetical protein